MTRETNDPPIPWIGLALATLFIVRFPSWIIWLILTVGK